MNGREEERKKEINEWLVEMTRGMREHDRTIWKEMAVHQREIRRNEENEQMNVKTMKGIQRMSHERKSKKFWQGNEMEK